MYLTESIRPEIAIDALCKTLLLKELDGTKEKKKKDVASLEIKLRRKSPTNL